MEKKYTVFRYLAYSLEILLFYILQGTPLIFPEILGGRPVLLIPIALTVAFFEGEIPAMFFGLACGSLVDIGTGGSIGFYAFMLTLICFIISNIFRDYMVINFLNGMAFCGGIITGLICLQFLFFYVFQGRVDAGLYFVQHYISRIVYTVLLSPVFYAINKYLYKNLRDR